METEERENKDIAAERVEECKETLEAEVSEPLAEINNEGDTTEVAQKAAAEASDVLGSAQEAGGIISTEKPDENMQVDENMDKNVTESNTLDESKSAMETSEITDEKIDCNEIMDTSVSEETPRAEQSTGIETPLSTLDNVDSVVETDNIEKSDEITKDIREKLDTSTSTEAPQRPRIMLKISSNLFEAPKDIAKSNDQAQPSMLKISSNLFEAPKDVAKSKDENQPSMLKISSNLFEAPKDVAKSKDQNQPSMLKISSNLFEAPKDAKSKDEEMILFDQPSCMETNEERKILKPRQKAGLLVRALSKENSNDSNSNPENLTDFVDASENTTDDLPEIMDRDPIAEESMNLDSKADADAESILPEVQQRDEKIMITHCHDNELKICKSCDKERNPKYIGQKDALTIFFCGDDCLAKFKEENPESFVEKFLRLRSFAAHGSKILQAPKVAAITEKTPEHDIEPDTLIRSDPQRICGNCKQMINVDDYLSWEAVDFCHEGCLLMYQKTISSNCAKCKQFVTAKVTGKYCVRFGNKIKQFCNTSCLLNYKKVFKFCTYCQEDLKLVKSDLPNFCSRQCLEMCHVDRKIVEKSGCGVCHKFKPVEIKLKLLDKNICFCSDTCFIAYKFVNQINPMKCGACVTFFNIEQSSHTIFVEGEKFMFCSENCQKIYLITNRRIVLCCNCSVKKYNFDMVKLCENHRDIAYACSNNCLQVYFDKIIDEQMIVVEGPIKQLEAIAKVSDFMLDQAHLSDVISLNVQDAIRPIHKIVITKPRQPAKQRNVATMCKPNLLTKAVTCKPRESLVATQTEKVSNHMYIPIPVPIFVPVPVHMYVDSVPTPLPIALPIPIPIFIPTNRKSVAGIGKEILKIKNKVPADPLEAELLMMAEMAAGPKKDESSSESEAEDDADAGKAEESFQSEEAMDDANASFGEDVLTMALKMASDFEEPTELEPSETAPAASPQVVKPKRGRKPGRKSATQQQEVVVQQQVPAALAMQQHAGGINMEDKPDANLNLKFTFGVNAWKQWVTIKNAELSKTSKRPKLFKPEILQLTSDDLNFSLCLFVKEVRKPNGTEYAPDTIYYLCLGIQQFLYENGRIDNIFCDPFYEKFTDTFNEVCQKFANLYDESQYIVTRVEEEHLWESKQLGAHSPLVLLNTLMFFNTKHFSLTSVDEHLQLSFSHIMKHWKRNPHQPGARNVLLRFYPPQNAESRKKKVYEQQENDENPLRCPVKLYEFFLSKCPESVKTRNDVFYLQPERSCVPDSPVWYSTMALDKEPLEKMLNRVKMVKEINVALLTS